MDQGQDKLDQRIDEKRREVADDILRLENKVRDTIEETKQTAQEKTNPRNVVESRPLVFLGAALGVGLYLGLTLGAYIRVSIPGLTPGAARQMGSKYDVYLPRDLTVRRTR